jgi:hypothetical protein
MKTGLIVLAFAMPFLTIGQTAKKALKKINNLEQMEDFKSQYPNWEIYEDKTMESDSVDFPEISKAKPGDVLLKQFKSYAFTFVLKILAEREEELCKLKYIYLDGNVLSLTQIDSIRTVILAKYKSGDSFESLVKAYTMDSNPTGDLDWFSKGMMVEQFDMAVRDRKKDEIFPVDVVDKKWYYIVLKTHANKVGKAKISVIIKYNT